jgi:tripartite-type tricarboxylate transporter receptor subunit TctC
MIRKLSLAVMLAALAASLQAMAQGQYPSRPIAMIIPAPPGGPTDLGGRILAKGMAEVLGQPVVAENRPGAATIVGVAMLARAAPDGYTIGALANAGVTSPFALGNEVPYKLEDLAPLGTVFFDYSVVTVRTDTRWQNIRELMDYARQNPGKLSYGAPGVGSMGHMSMEFVKLAYGVQIEFVPYAGSAPTITSVLGGHVDLGSANVSVSLSHIKAGKLRALAIASPKRVAALPDVPTVGESGKGDPPNFWLGAFVPAKTAAPIIEKLARTIEQILKDPAMTSALDKAGLIADYRNPAETRQFIDDEIKTIRNIAKSVNLK